MHGRDESLPYRLPISGSWPKGCGGVKTPPYGAKDKRVAMARLRAGHARPLRNMVMWDVGRPAPRPPGRFAAMRSLTDRRCRGRRPRRPAEVSGGAKVHGRDESLPYGRTISGSWPGGGGGVKPPPYGAKDKGRGGVNGLCTRGAREGGSPPLCSGRRLPGNGLQRTARRNPPVT